MSELSAFLAENVKKQEVKYLFSKRFLDEEGKDELLQKWCRQQIKKGSTPEGQTTTSIWEN